MFTQWPVLVRGEGGALLEKVRVVWMLRIVGALNKQISRTGVCGLDGRKDRGEKE